jgi:replicative DNA helicase
MEQNTLEITERSEVFEFASLRELVNQALQQNFGEIQLSNGLSTGFRDLDKVINGFKKGQLATIAVKPGMGKTALMLSIANNLAIKNNHAIAIFSSERSSTKITSRLIESETGMSLEKLTRGKLKPSERDHMFSLVGQIAKANIYLDDTPNLSVEELILKARQLKDAKDIEMIIIDYLELMTTIEPVEGSRPEQLSLIVDALKNIARELNIPILLFSQIPGQYPNNVLKRPALDDIPVYLSEHSDVVMMLHRSDLVFRTGQENLKNDIVEVIVGKYNGNRSESVVELRFIESLAKFGDR